MQIAVAPPGLEDVLAQELGSKLIERRERLFFVEDGTPCYWAANTWYDVEKVSFSSISQAAKHLRGIQRNWALHSIHSHRRAQLIQDQLPPMKAKALTFPAALPKLPLGSWTLLDESTMLCAARCSSLFPDGELNFAENRDEPPSRAYLKLWEYFSLASKMPGPGDKVLDVGSSPGGWTWVLDQLGSEVISVDKAPLSATAKFSPRVKFKAESAFGLEPSQIGKIDWFFSDIICYPERLLELIHKWKDHARSMVCTIKFQGPTNFEIIPEFLKIPGSTVQHLSANKHELTWSRIG